MGKEIYFTFRSGDSGLTDLMWQFSAWYKLERSLGYKYVHQPLNCDRSSPRILEFMGFEALWERQPPYPGPPESKVELPWHSPKLRFPYSLGFLGLRWFIRKQVREAARKVKGRYLLVEFRIGAFVSRDSLFRLIEDAVPSLPDGIDLRRSYFERQAENPRPDPFEPRKRKVFVHIRQGDTAVLPTPWGTYLSVFGKFVTEYPSLHAVPTGTQSKPQEVTLRSLRAYVDPDDFLEFLKQFTADAAGEPCSIVVSSDGFGMAFERVRQAATNLELSPQQLSLLEEMAVSYDSLKFRNFASLECARLLVGETDENLFDMIHAAFTADVIVMSHQQRMMFKLLAVYGRTENPPVLVVLTNHDTDVSYMKEALGSKVSEVVAVRARGLS